MVVTCYPFLQYSLSVGPHPSPVNPVPLTGQLQISLSDRSHSRLTVCLTAQPHAHRAPGSIALWLSFPGLVGELGFVSGVECLDNCALGLIDLGLDLEHHGLVDW